MRSMVEGAPPRAAARAPSTALRTRLLPSSASQAPKSGKPDLGGGPPPPLRGGGLLLAAALEEAELHGRVARGLGQDEVAEGVGREHTAAGRALQEAALDEEGLDDLLDGVAGLGQRRRHGLDADRAAAIRGRDGG